jgi:hypothetical protein
MGELLPEFWAGAKESNEEGRKARHSKKVTEICTWVQCFGTYVAVLIPELMAYMATIVRVSQDFAGFGWVRYDAAFRRQAALTGNTIWSKVNATMYAMNFTGAANSEEQMRAVHGSHPHRERVCTVRQLGARHKGLSAGH